MANPKNWIVAQSSSVGRNERSIVRVSGDSCFDILKTICSTSFKCSNGYQFYDEWVSFSGNRFPVRIYIMKSSASYTREDLFELHLPGSPFVVSFVLEQLLRLGCKLAEPGEFTKRAFLNGRIDLIQAESVTRLISAKSEVEYRKALDGLTGRVTSIIHPLREKLFFLVRDLTVDLDFDEEIEEQKLLKTKKIVQSLLNEMDTLIDEISVSIETSDRKKVILCGPVNAGKSTIFNQFSGEKSAIVSPQKGTTRDVLGLELSLNGYDILLQDSPGWGVAVDELDTNAQLQSFENMKIADILIIVVDINRSLSEQLPNSSFDWFGRSFVVLNKLDMETKVDESEVCKFFNLDANELIRISGKNDVDLLQKKLQEELELCESSYGAAQLTARQVSELKEAKSGLIEAIGAIELGAVDALEFELRIGLKALSRVTGDEVDENILTSIFEGFCIGK